MGLNLNVNLQKKKKIWFNNNEKPTESIENNCLTVPNVALLATGKPATVRMEKDELQASQLHPFATGNT